MRKIAFITKYPPIEGGVSSNSYWTARGLGRRGNDVHVVTNSQEVEPEYRQKLEDGEEEFYQLKGVTVHNTNDYVSPWHIPYSNPYTEKLASIAIDAIEAYGLEAIYSFYIQPYGVSGFLAKQFTGKPQVLRHAGSDVGRLLLHPKLSTLYKKILQSADKIITSKRMEKTFCDMGVQKENLFYGYRSAVDTEAFSPSANPLEWTELERAAGRKIDENTPIITYLGKVAVPKGIFDLTSALSRIKKDFLLLLVCGDAGAGFEELKEDVKSKKLSNKTAFLNFVPPWRIPPIMKRSTCVVIPERDFPIAIHGPTIPREAMCTGKCTILSDELYNKHYYPGLENGVHTTVVNPHDLEKFSQELEKIISNPDAANEMGREASKIARQYEDFEASLVALEKLFETIAK